MRASFSIIHSALNSSGSDGGISDVSKIYKKKLIILTVNILNYEGMVTCLMAKGDACIDNLMLLLNNLARRYCSAVTCTCTAVPTERRQIWNRRG